METAIAAAAVQLLAPYLAKAGDVVASKAGEATWKLAEHLYQIIRRKFAADNDSYAQETLRRVEAAPNDANRQQVLSAILNEKAVEDATFAAKLEKLVEQAARTQSINQYMTNVHGNAWVDNIVNIGTSYGQQTFYFGSGGTDPHRAWREAPTAARITGVLGIGVFLSAFGVAFYGFYQAWDSTEPPSASGVGLVLGLFFSGFVLMILSNLISAIWKRRR